MTTQSFDVCLSRENSILEPLVENVMEDDALIDELIQYSARKFSVFVPLKSPKDEHTILDDADYYMSKNECDYMCHYSQTKKRLQTNWCTIEEIIENDPEIIFENDRTIVVEPVKEGEETVPSESFKKQLEKAPSIVNMRNKMHTS